MVERDEGGRYLPGTVGNPGGRPKIPEVVRSRIQGLTVEAVEVLKDCLSSKDEKVRLEAAKHILDRAYGRPAQSTELKIDGGGAASMLLQALLESAERRKAARAQQIDGQAIVVGEVGQA